MKNTLSSALSGHKRYAHILSESGEKLGKIDVTKITLGDWFYCSDLYPQNPEKYITYWAKGHIRNQLLCYVEIHFPTKKYGCNLFEDEESGDAKVDSMYPFPFEDRNVKITVTKREKVW